MQDNEPRPPGSVEFLTFAELKKQSDERARNLVGRTRPPRSTDRAMVSIYRREEAYYLLVDHLIANGPWAEGRDQPAAVFERTLDAARLGGVLADALGPSAWVDPDPKAAHAKQLKPPVLRQAKVRSWLEFVRPALHLTVRREQTDYRVHPWSRELSRLDAVYKPAADGHARLTAPLEEQLGSAVLRSFKILAAIS